MFLNLINHHGGKKGEQIKHGITKHQLGTFVRFINHHLTVGE
jgi:hypothetical protein